MVANIKDKFVVDASFILASLLPDESTPKVERAISNFIAGHVEFISCPLLPFEVANGLAAALLSKRINEKQALDLAKSFSDLRIEIKGVDIYDSLSLAIKKRISVYDASYLVLAKENRFKFLTLDTHLP